MSKCSADETPVCCCMDVGTIMDNSDCTASYSRVFANRAEAEQTLAALTEKARSVESEPCKITPTFTEESDGVRLDIMSLLNYVVINDSTDEFFVFIVRR